MPTFRRVEVVDARKFEGGGQNGTELVFWVNSNEGKALWISNQKFDNRESNTPEHIRIYEQLYSSRYEIGYVGDWIMQRQDGHFEVVRQEELDSEYEQV